MARYGERLTAARIARILSEQELGETESLFRTIKHLTNQGLIDTVGAVNTGSGRSRLYKPSALIHAAILLRLHRLGVTAGTMRDTVDALSFHLREDHNSRDVIQTAEEMKEPTIFILIPAGPRAKVSVQLLPCANSPNPSAKRDAVVIHIARFLESVKPFL